MYKTLKVAAVAFALTGVTLATVSTVRAADDVSVTFNSGDVAFGYTDGYWDNHHAWHAWQHPSDRDAYRKAKSSEYHDWKHDRDTDQGWHDKK